MGLLRKSVADLVPTLLGTTVNLRAPRPEDWREWAELRNASRAFLTPWEPTWSVDDLDRASFRRRLGRWDEEARQGVTCPWFVVAATGGRLLGGVTLAQIRRGVTQAGTIGYWMGAAHAGKGFMSEAVGLLAGHAFREFGLHRLEAACLPENDRSIRLLEKVGFTREGYARAYVAIDGRWRDHILWGLLADDPLYPVR